ncbi:MAG: InlB B-repeat-containing protein, partial [Oscillospiraceae bacterium]|nr:InlB B-repeat-containing protein [Oscillospiraceae bacterium]
MRRVKRSCLERGLLCLLCMVMLVSFLPELPLTAFAAVESEVEVTGETDDTLTHQTIHTTPCDAGSGEALITLDGMMPPHAEVTVQSCESPPAASMCAYDISITDANGEVFQPETGASIQVRIENPAIGEAAAQEQNLRLWHIGDDGVREEIRNFRIQGDSIVFDATGFSIYEVDNGTPPLRTYYFKMPVDPANNTDYQLYYFPTTGTDADGHNKMICQQTIKNGEVPIFPQLPADISSRYTFMGWYRWENGTLSDTPFDFTQIDPVTKNETVILHAVFRSCVFAIFHDQYNGKSRNFPIMATRRGCLSAASGMDAYGNTADAMAEISIKDLNVVYDDAEQTEGAPPRMAFMGWTIIPPEYAASNDTIRQYIESNDVQVIQEDTIRISGTTRLYPVFEPICWLEFNTSQEIPAFVPTGQDPRTYVGATYKPPLYFSPDDGFRFDEGETPQTIPFCAGYKFQGWYTAGGDPVTDADLHLVSGLNTNELEVRDNRLYFKQISGQPKVHQVDLYAKWEPIQSTYTVVVWRQKESDDKNATK